MHDATDAARQFAVDWRLLDVLSDPDRRELLTRARTATLRPPGGLVPRGGPGDSLHLVSGGHIALRIHTPLGDIATMRIVRPGEFFGEVAVVSPVPRNATNILTLADVEADPSEARSHVIVTSRLAAEMRVTPGTNLHPDHDYMALKIRLLSTDAVASTMAAAAIFAEVTTEG